MSITDDLNAERESISIDRAREAAAQLIVKHGIQPDEIAEVVRWKFYQSMSKDNDGEPQITDLFSMEFRSKWDDGPEWPVVQQAKPCTVKPVATTPKDPGDWHTAVILPDTQIGYRRDLSTMELDPFHDEAAMNVALQIMKAAKPDLVINLGDMMDFPQFGTYEQEPGFALTAQETLDRSHRWLAEQIAAAPGAAVRFLEGNHDRRLEKALRNNAMAAFGLKRANEPDGWPVMSVPHLLHLDELGVEYVGGYPAGITWINERLACIHGHKVRSNGSTASAVIDDERVSVIFGHVHRIELQHKTRRTFAGAKQNFAATPGCLSRIDGAVPSVKSSTDPMGRPVMTWENWQQGIAVVEYLPGDAPFHLELVPIIEGSARFRGRTYSAP